MTTNESVVSLDYDQIRKLAPSVFTEEKATRTSDQYSRVSTLKVIEDLKLLGWIVVDAIERKSKIVQGYQKHIVWFRNQNIIFTNAAGEVEGYPEICFINSHDGLTALQFSLSLYKLKCNTRLIFQSDNFSNHRVIHKGYNFVEVSKIVDSITLKAVEMISIIEQMKKVQLTAFQIEQYFTIAVAIREKYSQGTKIKVDIRAFSTPKKEQDSGDSLWEVYNLTHDKLLIGGFLNTDNNRTAKKINYLDKILWINKDLFELTETYFSTYKSIAPTEFEGNENHKQYLKIKELVRANKTVPEILSELNISKKRYYSLLTDSQKEELNEIRTLLKN